MATQIQFRRGTNAQHAAFTGATAEVTVNTTNKSIHVHDGTTQGGFELARADLTNTSGLSLAGLTTIANLKVSNDLYVSGVSTFVGAVTFQGGTITLGDANTDNVVFTADVNSNIVPNTDNSYDLGSSSQQWRNLYVNGTSDLTDLYASGIATATTLHVGSNIKANSGILTATTFSGNLAKTLTLNTSGTGLSGSTAFNNSGDATFTVTSNATNANTASTLVSRDGSGNFIAGVITAYNFLWCSSRERIYRNSTTKYKNI